MRAALTSTHDAVRRLLLRLGLILLAVTLFAGGTLLEFSDELHDAATGPTVMNTAGRQRMLTERITQLSLMPLVNAAHVPSDTALPGLTASAVGQQVAAQRLLIREAERLRQQGQPEPGAVLGAMQPLLDEFHRTVATVHAIHDSSQAVDGGLGRALRQMRGAELRLLDAYERVTKTFDTAYTVRLAALRDVARLRIILGTVVLLLLIGGLLWPSVRELQAAQQHQASLAAQMQRRDSEVLALVSEAPVGIFRIDAAGEVAYVNPMHCALTGLMPEQSKGAGWRAVIHPDDVARVGERWTAAQAAHAVYQSEHRYRRPDGTVREVAVQAHPIRLPDGTHGGYVGTVVDQTERNRLLRDLARTASFQRALVEGTSYAVIATQPDGVIVQLNPAAETLLGYAADDLIQRATPGVFHDSTEVVACASELTRALGRPVVPGFDVFVALCDHAPHSEREWTYVRKDGVRVPVMLAVSAIRTDDGELIGFLGVARDLRAQRAREEERRRQLEAVRAAELKAVEATRMKSNFMANMSHEIRTPMNAIIGFTDMVLEHSALDEFQRDSLQTVHGAAAHLLDLVNDILDFSKIEAGQMRMEHIPFDVRTVVTDVAALLQPRAVAKSLTLSAEIAADVGPTQIGDPARVRQILLNFAGNALKFTEHGRVDLRVVRAGPGALRLEVRDSGIGMPADVVDRIFEQFVQADDSTARRFGGTGLGLSIAKELAELMGGAVGVASVVGRGSTFWCELPLEPGAPSGSVTMRVA